jgi:hypothetical protein
MPFGACWVSIERADTSHSLPSSPRCHPLPRSGSISFAAAVEGLSSRTPHPRNTFSTSGRCPPFVPGEEGERAIVAKREPMRHISLGRRVGGVVVLAKARTAYVLSLS